MADAAPTHDPDFDDPTEISDYVLELTRRGYVERDFDLFSSRFVLPHPIGTFQGERLLETRDDIRAVFDAMCAEHDALGAIDLKRKTISARFLGDGRVQHTIETRLVLHGYSLSDEVIAHGTLRLMDHRWMIETSSYATTLDGITRAFSATA